MVDKLGSCMSVLGRFSCICDLMHFFVIWSLPAWEMENFCVKGEKEANHLKMCVQC